VSSTLVWCGHAPVDSYCTPSAGLSDAPRLDAEVDYGPHQRLEIPHRQLRSCSMSSTYRTGGKHQTGGARGGARGNSNAFGRLKAPILSELEQYGLPSKGDKRYVHFDMIPRALKFITNVEP
jgi:hypothetical protein